MHARELRFREPPQTGVTFSGTPGRSSVSDSERVNLPYRVDEQVDYRHVRVRYALASRLDPDLFAPQPDEVTGGGTADEDAGSGEDGQEGDDAEGDR